MRNTIFSYGCSKIDLKGKKKKKEKKIIGEFLYLGQSCSEERLAKRRVNE